MLTFYTTRSILFVRLTSFILVAILAWLPVSFANAQSCPDPGGGIRWLYFNVSDAVNFFPENVPAGKTGAGKATSGKLTLSETMNAVYPLRMVTINPELSDGTTGKVVLRFDFLDMAPAAVINIYQGASATGTPAETITSANASGYLLQTRTYTGSVTVTFESPVASAGGDFKIFIPYTTGDEVATSAFGFQVAYWKKFITPNSYTVMDSYPEEATPIATAYFDANKNLVSSELSFCIDYGKPSPSMANSNYIGQVVFFPHARPDLDKSGTADGVDQLKAARLVYIMKNIATPATTYQNFMDVQGAVNSTLGPNYAGHYPGLHGDAIDAIPSLPSPAEPVFSITGPATVVSAGTPQNFTVNLTDDGGHPRVFKLELPAGVTLNSVTGATYDAGNSTLTFASSPASATVSVTSAASTTATLRVVYNQPDFWNVNNLIIYEPCTGLNDFQGFIGLSKGDITYPFREASATWAAQPAFPCSELSYVIGNRNIGGSNVSDGYTLDLSSGVTTLGKQTLIEGPNAFINAIGYNTVDNYIWGFRYGTNQLVRIGSDWSVTFHDVTGFPSPVPGYATGDVSPNGILYLYASNSNQITKVDLNPGSANYLTAVTVPTTPTDLNDWSFNPTNGMLYGFGTSKVLYQFDPATGNRTTLGSVTGAGIETSTYTGAFGTAFFDTDGDMYVGNNGSGAIFKISAPLTNLTASLFSTASGVTPGDGARCPSAIVNDPPVAVNDNGTTTCNAATVDVLANDVAGSAPLVPSSVKLLTPGTLARVTTLTVADQGEYNVNNVTGAITFTPVEGLRDTISIDYVVIDGNGLESIATLTIIVDCPMPVTLVAFDARKEGNTALLTWSTTEEVNSDRFEIERSRNGKVWSTIGSIRSNGESSVLRNYTYTDGSPEKGENLYRLRMVDLDGTYAFSAIKAVFVENGTERISVYPNPVVNGKLTITIPGSERYRAELTTLTGNLVLQQSLTKNQELNLHGLASGMYVLRFISTSGDVQTKMFVVK
ncbi:putative secreted protein (Por secretion system target) [Dyadobacter jiangsuensis]|uniref:Putative secreted protein (Por secretion system target) n=1 Tax=Dyadobacter jiangsuensis TaxID=1591085 RepID=A0A2P8FI78_9BACT|nr:putative secreted protein (Por secretion system target) [Dyadobacter jiangsuensis]